MGKKAQSSHTPATAASLTSPRPIPSNPRSVRKPARKAEKQGEHEARANEGMQDCERRRVLCSYPGRNETSDKGQRIQFVGDDHPPVVNDRDREHEPGENCARGAPPSRRDGDARQNRADANGADPTGVDSARPRQTMAETS